MFSAADLNFNPHALPPLITAVAILLLGLTVVVREKGSRESLLYLGYTLAASTWMFCVSVALSLSSEAMAYRWMIYSSAGVTMIPAALYHFTVVVMRTVNRHRQLIRFAWTVSASFLAVILLSDILFDGLHHYSWGIFLKFRWPAVLFMVYFFTMTVMTLREYWIAYRSSDRNATRHRRAKAFLIAFGIGYLGSLDFLPALGVPYYPMSSLPMICMLVLVSRTIWRHRLVDITPAFAAREIIDTMNDALIVVDLEGVVRLVNQETCSLLECREEDLVGRRPVEGMTTCRQFAEQIESIAGKGSVRNLEAECGRHHDVSRVFNLSASLMRNHRGEPVATVCLVNDITDRKRAEKEREHLIAQLQEANEKLQMLDTMKTNFISTVSHELRTPLTTIKAFVELLLLKQGMPEDRKVKLMSTVNVETDRLARLIADLLDLSRIEAGSMKWQFALVSMEDIIRSVIESMGVLFENKGLRVAVELAPPLSPVNGDRDRLVQVVTNILSNAVKFTPRDGSIRIALRQEAAQIVVEIADSGIGIPAGHIDLIFEKFHRSDDTLTAAIEGTGLGLAITRQIVEYHGGSIWAASTQGKGSTFTFTLPLAVEP
ncbi:MAG: sensor histidine kinase [Nitrospirota bacterium]